MAIIYSYVDGEKYVSGSPEHEAAFDALKAKRIAEWEANNPGRNYEDRQPTFHTLNPDVNPWYGDNGVLTVDAEGNRGTKNTIYDTDLYPGGTPLPPDVADEFNPYGPDNPAPPFVGPQEHVPTPNPTGTGGGAFNPGGNQTGNQVSNPNPTSPWEYGSGNEFPYNPPPGIPLNPIVSENPNIFSPYGQAAARMSNITTFGGLPRSTGPWDEMGGYYGGNPYTQRPDDLPGPIGLPGPGNPGAPVDSPWQPPVGGGSPDPNQPGPWLPPAQPITLPDPLTQDQIDQAAQAAALRAAGL
jgi:hypothetical protein